MRDGISIASFATAAVPVRIVSVSLLLVFSFSNGTAKKSKTRRLENLNKIVLLARSKLNSIENRNLKH